MLVSRAVLISHQTIRLQDLKKKKLFKKRNTKVKVQSK